MRKTLGALMMVVALGAAAGCGSSAPAERDAKVATLSSAAASPSASVPSQRPRERLDTTPEEFLTMLKPYYGCMVEQGAVTEAETARAEAAGGVAKPSSKAQMVKWEAADRICKPQFYPLPPWEKDPANPESRDFAVDVVKCLKSNGVEYVAVSEDGVSIALGGDQNDPRSIRLGMEKIPECERQAAAKVKK